MAALAPSVLLLVPRLVLASCEVLFEPAIRFDTGPRSVYMATGDFNQDGLLDLAVTIANDAAGDGAISSVAILLGTGGRGFAAPVLYPTDRTSHGIVTADFNHDGITDLAVANKSNDISILFGLGAGGVGNGTFSTPAQVGVSGAPFDLVAGDFDRDGITDLAVCLNTVGGVALLRGLGSGGVGDGTFATAGVLPINSISSALEAGDFNHDGVLDLAATEYGTSSVAVLIGTGSTPFGAGSFSAAVHYSVAFQPFGLGIADFNADGNLDLVAAHSSGGGIRVLNGTAAGTFTVGASLASGNSNAVASGDFDGDGFLDLATGHVTGYDAGSVEIYRGHGDGMFGTVEAYAAGHDAYQVVAGNFDADGYVDLFVAAGYGNYVSLLPGTCASAPPDPRLPVLTDVRDVPNDDGGKVFVTWTASSLDATGGAVREYRVWRRIPPALAAAAARPHEDWLAVSTLSADGSTSVVYWEALVTLPAQRLSGYGYTAPTTQDSMRTSNPYTAFFVTALTSNIDVFYSSNVDSGYSVDNLKPHQPGHLAGGRVDGGYSIQWDENTEADLAGYRVYRGASENFVPSDANRIADLAVPGYLDPGAIGGESYKLSAIDQHGNESEFAVLPPAGIAGVDPLAVGFFLRGARPNPSRGRAWTIELSLARAEAARLEVIDLAGRRMIVRELRELGAGHHAVTLAESAKLPAGVYLVRLTQGGARREVKAVRMD